MAPTLTQEQADFVQKAQIELQQKLEPVFAFAFGDNPELANHLADLVVHGTKRATTALPESFTFDGIVPPQVGDLSLVLNGSGQPVAIIRTSETRYLPFHAVDARFAYDEGEGERTLEDWRAGHLRYFARESKRVGISFYEDTLVFCERFELLYPIPSAQSHQPNPTNPIPIPPTDSTSK